MLSIRSTVYLQKYKQPESKGLKKIYHEFSNPKRAGAAILTSHKLT